MTSTITELLATLARDGGQPRLTWYGSDGERIELSGAVLANWVTKTTNLLVEEFDAEAGVVVASDLPPHWRTLVWALATWRAGAELRLVEAGDSGPGSAPARPALTGAPDVVVTADPSRWVAPAGEARRAALVAVSLPALARRYDGDLPRGAVDAASAVMTYGDQLGYVPPVDPGATALSGAGVPLAVDHGGLLGWATERGDAVGKVAADAAATRERVLVRTSLAPGAVTDLLARVLGIWSAGGSVVVLNPHMTTALEADLDRLSRLVTAEHVTVT